MFVQPLRYYPHITFQPNLHIMIILVGSSRTFMDGKHHLGVADTRQLVL